MNKTDEKYIQLPPLERDLDPKILSVIWEYCLMDKKNQIMIKEEMQRIDNSKDEEIDKATIEAIESMSERIPKEEIAGLEEAMKSKVAKCMHDACVLAHLVYTEVVTGERTIYELMESYPSFASYALMMQMYGPF